MPIPYDDSRDEFTLRGGSLRKIGKIILTRTPALGATSILALGALLYFDTASRAGECIEQAGTPARYICSGVINDESDVTQTHEAGSGEQLVVTQTGPFGVSVNDGNALELYGYSDSTGINANFEATLRTTGKDGKAGIFIYHQGNGDVHLANSNGDIRAEGDGIRVNHLGTGVLSITLADTATITSAKGYGLYAKTGNTEQDITGGMDISVSGHIGTEDTPTGKSGIFLMHRSRGDANITLSKNMNIFTKDKGLRIETVKQVNDINLRANANIQSVEEGIQISHHGTGDVYLNVTGDIRITSLVEDIVGDEGIEVFTHQDSGGVDLNFSGNIHATQHAIDIFSNGTGDISARIAEGSMLHAEREKGIRVYSYNSEATGDIDVHVAGRVGTQAHYTGHEGVLISAKGTGDISATLAASGNILSKRAGIKIKAAETMQDIAVRAHGDIVSKDHEGMDLDHKGTGDINIAVAHGANVQGRQGIVATRNRNTDYGASPRPGSHPKGTVHIDVDGRVQGETTAINMDAGGTHRLILRTGSQIIGNITSTAATDAFIVLDDSINSRRHGSLDLDGISGFSRLYKNGAQSWNLTGDMDEDQAFTLVTHNGGNMFIDDFALFTAPESPDDISVLIERDASLFVQGNNGRIEGNIHNSGELALSQTGFIRGNLSNSGTLEVAGNNRITGDLTGAGTVVFQRGNDNAALTVNGDFEIGGTVIFNFSAAHGYTNALDIQGELIGTEPTRVEIHAFGIVPSNLDDTTPLITASTPEPSTDEFSINEIDSGVTIEHADSFASERFIAGAFVFDFEYDEALEGWGLQYSGFSPRVPVFKNYPASLVQLARLSSAQGRGAWLVGEGRGLWAKPEGANTHIEPSAATVKSSYEIRDKRVRFGLNVPLDLDALYGMGRGLHLGANLSLGSADTDAAAIENNESDGSIGTDLLTFALDVRWIRSRGFYADAQAQYAVFSSDITSQQESMTLGNDANAFNLSGELGYRFDMLGFSFVPQAQVQLSKVDFEDFIAPDNEIVSLEDGKVVDGRIGLVFDKQWSSDSQNRLSLSAGAHLHFPFDGKTVTNVSGVFLISELKDVSLDLSAGLDYQWGNNIFTASLATAQGDEIEDYRASLSARFAF